ncbi:Methyltransferase-related protein [Zostera marina]|uniref:Methyltransferase-related protein n=1 Tax=Zostera marina TaxID=29655 RepID=A0A0K9PDE1_ZOSMR|nr:Methyltransferase-related protein [Zostera marina]
MCPLRVILIFLSAMLAGYFAWKSAQSDDTDIFDADVDASTSQMKKKQSSSFKTTIGNGFWTVVDMASGRYLWKNLVVSESEARS